MNDYPIKIKATGSVMLTDEVRSHVSEKLSKLFALISKTDTTALAEVELESLPNSRLGGSYRAEITFTFEGGMARSEAVAETLHAALDEAAEEARRELKKNKTKHRDFVRRGAKQVKEFFRNFGG